MISTEDIMTFYPKSAQECTTSINHIKNIVYNYTSLVEIILKIKINEALVYEVIIKEEQEDIKNLLAFIEKEAGIFPTQAVS